MFNPSAGDQSLRSIWVELNSPNSGERVKVPGGLMVKNPLASAGDIRDVRSVPGSGRSPGEGYEDPLLYSCLENPMDRGEVTKHAHA